MSALIKKEVRLLAPACLIALPLALLQAATRPDDFYIVALVFFGLTLMALSTFGRESSLNTFSGMLAQPAERLRIWQAKLSVLALGFLLVFGIWLIAYAIARQSHLNFYDQVADTDFFQASQDLFIAISLIAVATFTGGLWTTLLIRQIAGAFWLSLLVPAVLAGFTAAVLAVSHLDDYVITALCLITGVYSLAGFFFARWLFFRAQDVGWTGGVITLPEWRLFSPASGAFSQRKRRPFFALLKNELQLHRGSLVAGAALFVLHTAIIILRTQHHFPKNSPGELLTATFWMFWLILPIMIGSMAVAEERRLGIIETQFTLPVSRRRQFALKCFIALALGTFLGGVIPMLLEKLGIIISGGSLIFLGDTAFGSPSFFEFQMYIIGTSAGLALISFFGSSLAKNFLQAIGYAIVSCIVCAAYLTNLGEAHLFSWYAHYADFGLFLLISIPTVICVLLWLSWLNYKNFRNGWPLWRRNLLVFAGAALLATAATITIYNRAWEIFQPLEPTHGEPRLSLANPPQMRRLWDTLQVQLPDGRVWVDHLTDPTDNPHGFFTSLLSSPIPKSLGPEQFIPGSHWRSLLTDPDDYAGRRAYRYLSIGIQQDGTLWLVTNSTADARSQGQVRIGNASHWQQVAFSPAGLLFLDTDGTLWRCPYSRDFNSWYGLTTNQLVRVTLDSDWQQLHPQWPGLAQKTDGTVWLVNLSQDKNVEHQQLEQQKTTNSTNTDLEMTSTFSQNAVVYVAGGKLFVSGLWKTKMQTSQIGIDTNWLAASHTDYTLVALKSGGSIWRWELPNYSAFDALDVPPQRLGMNDDWVAVSTTTGGALTLAADGSLWLWPDHSYYWHSSYGTLTRIPKQPQPLANIFYPK